MTHALPFRAGNLPGYLRGIISRSAQDLIDSGEILAYEIDICWRASHPQFLPGISVAVEKEHVIQWLTKTEDIAALDDGTGRRLLAFFSLSQGMSQVRCTNFTHPWMRTPPHQAIITLTMLADGCVFHSGNMYETLNMALGLMNNGMDKEAEKIVSDTLLVLPYIAQNPSAHRRLEQHHKASCVLDQWVRTYPHWRTHPHSKVELDFTPTFRFVDP